MLGSLFRQLLRRPTPAEYRAGLVGTDTQEIPVDLTVGPDLYWAFIRQR